MQLYFLKKANQGISYQIKSAARNISFQIIYGKFSLLDYLIGDIMEKESTEVWITKIGMKVDSSYQKVELQVKDTYKRHMENGLKLFDIHGVLCQ
jgi:hypothetical protein